MEVNIYTGKKNDLVIGLVKRWTLTDDSKTITISLTKVGSTFTISQWAMDNNGDNIPDLALTEPNIAKKRAAITKINGMVSKYIPGFPKRSTYNKK